MHEVSYISDKDRARLVELNEAVRSCVTTEEQQGIRSEIAEIELRRKPLHECTLPECSELRTFVYNKFDRLNRTGKYHIALQFKQLLARIEIRQATIHQQMNMAERQRLIEKAQGKAAQVDKAEEVKKKRGTSTGTTKSGTASSRWTTGIGNLD
jgi:hypothetical protein